MTATETTSPPAVDPPPTRVRVAPESRPSPRTKNQPPYAVVLHNDDINRFEWVIGVLTRVLRCGGMKAFWLVMKAHVGGRAIVWSGSLEVAELKAEQIRGVGPDPQKVSAGAMPLQTSVEPLPD
jgi:ATP-dependent Clp protease adaptor protein ClpS